MPQLSELPKMHAFNRSSSADYREAGNMKCTRAGKTQPHLRWSKEMNRKLCTPVAYGLAPRNYLTGYHSGPWCPWAI